MYKFDKVPNSKIFVENSDLYRKDVRKRILEESLIPYKCELCGNIGEWMGHTIPLELDHRNGINNDNRLENLRFLCPNCHASTPTYSEKNNALKNKSKNKISMVKNKTNIKEIYYCKNCNKQLLKKRKTGLCTDCYNKIERVNTRKVDRPSYEQLLEDKKTMSMLAIGKKYGVSDNAVRKWIKQYEKIHINVDVVE
jgi:Zn finger protein HypA/HybF involved in hydrogenase expression